MTVNLVARLMGVMIVVSVALVGVARGTSALLPSQGQLAAEQFHPAARSSEIDLLDIGHGIGFDVTKPLNASARNPQWSPDGSKIAFLSPSQTGLGLYVMNWDGGGLRLLYPVVADGVFAWSPDGRQIAFVCAPKAHLDVCAVNLETAASESLTDGLAAYSPAWSPDGSRIAFTASVDNQYGIYTVRTDNRNLRSVFSASQTSFFSPIWSPDGRQIVLGGSRSCPSCGFSIYTVNDDGSHFLQLSGDGAADVPIWSPDGSMIAFSGYGNASREIYTVSADGTRLDNLTHSDTQDDVFPQWSPDGRQIAFISAPIRHSSSTLIYVINADGSGIHPVNQVPAFYISLAWRP
jgi:Tol biopolymer transport system component